MGIRTVVIAVALAAAVLAGCSSIIGPPKCDPDSCTGCCADDHTCVAGTSKTQCGGNGGMCDACGMTSICFMHKCSGGSTDGGTGGGGGGGGSGGGGDDGGVQLPCEGTCNGCCVGELCYQGNDTSNCGAGGNVCSGCAGGQSCATKVCVDSSCNGCITGSTCHTSPNDSHCGIGGASCFDCSSFGATCTTATGVCTGGTCAGCIDAQGHCQSGLIKGFCGLGGGACNACGQGQGCSDGGCVMVGNGMSHPGDDCSGPEAVVLNTPIMGSTVGYGNDTMGTCGGTGPDHVYSFSLPSATTSLTITVAPSGATYTPVVFLRGACDSMQLGCSGAAGGGSPAALTVPDAGAGSYFIWVDGLGGSSGNYTLGVTAN